MMNTFKVYCVLGLAIGALVYQPVGATAETANFSAQIGADMITISTQMRYAQETPYVSLDDIMQQIDGIIALQPDRIQANWSGTTAVLSANEVSVRLPEGSFSLAHPVRQQDEGVYLSIADVPSFFASAFGLTFSRVEQVAPSSPVELTPIEPDDSSLDMSDESLLAPLDDGSIPRAGAAEGEGEGKAEGESAAEGEAAASAEGEAAAGEGEGEGLPVDLSGLSQVSGAIILDPGHGGQDTGAVGGNGANEKDVTLALALRISEILTKNTSIKVQMTRNEDVDFSPGNRKAVAETAGGALFLSIHAGFSATPRAQGMSIFADQGVQSSDETLSTAGKDRVVQRQQAAEKAGTLGYRIARAMGEDSIMGNVIVRSCPLLLQRELKMPVVLLEIAYLSNIDTATLLAEETYQEQAALCIASAVANALR